MYADIFASKDANLNDIWEKVEKGLKRRGERRDQAFNAARTILKEFIELRDHQVMQHNLGERSFLREINKFREKVSALQEENRELKSRIADIREWLVQEHEICLPKENESLATLQNARQH